MFFVKIEADTGEELDILPRNHETTGNPTFSFWCILEGACGASADEDFNAWFRELEPRLQQSLCVTCKPFLECFVAGEWEYGPEDYEKYKQEFVEPRYSREEFEKEVEWQTNTWVDIDALMACVPLLIQAVEIANFGDLFIKPVLLDDLEGLGISLAILKTRNAKKVRMRVL